MSGVRKPIATVSSRLATVLAGAALLALGVDAAAGQTGPTTVVRTYDVRLVGWVTTTAPDIVLTEKVTHTYRGVRIRVTQSGLQLSAGLVSSRRTADTDKPNGVMSGKVVYEETGSTPCSRSKQFQGPARFGVHGSGGRSFYVDGEWRGKPGGATFGTSECRGLFELGNEMWEHEKGRVNAQLDSSAAAFIWLLPRRTRGGLPFPVNNIYAHKSFTASASSSMDSGFGFKEGSLRVTFTARR